MQLRYVASELGTGLKRNVSMTIAVILTIFISLTLVGAGLLMRDQVALIQDDLGSRLELKIVFCSKNSLTDTCVQGTATQQQENDVRDTLANSPYVSSYRYETRQEAFDNFRAQYEGSGTQEDKILDQLDLKPSDMATSYWATQGSERQPGADQPGRESPRGRDDHRPACAGGEGLRHPAHPPAARDRGSAGPGMRSGAAGGEHDPAGRDGSAA
jgi:hypothetical protein